ncbi:hypothetical protein PAECIP111890_06270 [Paenibacillus sp. JJ-223]|nr:hypothetical protein PAECIP111890_06270 [Paenibacillus sp. JJ-223]
MILHRYLEQEQNGMSISVQNMAIRMWTGKLVLSTSYMVISIFLIHLKLDPML